MRKIIFASILVFQCVFSFISCTVDDKNTRHISDFDISINSRSCSVAESLTVTVKGALDRDFEDAAISVYFVRPKQSEKPYLEFNLESENEAFPFEKDSETLMYKSAVSVSEFSSVVREFSVSFLEAGEFWLVVEVSASCSGISLNPYQQIFPMRVSE